MSDQILSVFINPTAGRGRAGRRMPKMEALLKDAGLVPKFIESNAVGDLEQQVREHSNAGANRVVIAGGDGSVHEAVNGILTANQETAFGVIPSGTGNDFAKAAGIPLDWETATRLLAERISSQATPRRIDVGRMNGRYFANGAGVGFDAKVTHIARSYQWPVGDLVYLLAIFRAMVDGIATPAMKITSDNFEWDGPLTLANVSNGPWIGGMFHIAPMADNADGQLELLIAAPVTRRRIMTLLPKLVRGEHMSEPEVSHCSVQRLNIVADAAVPSHLDGEVQAPATHFDIEVLPAVLRLI